MSEINLGDLNKIIQFCNDNGLQVEMSYSEIDRYLEITMYDIFAKDALYMKKCSDVDYFLSLWGNKEMMILKQELNPKMAGMEEQLREANEVIKHYASSKFPDKEVGWFSIAGGKPAREYLDKWK